MSDLFEAFNLSEEKKAELDAFFRAWNDEPLQHEGAELTDSDRNEFAEGWRSLEDEFCNALEVIKNDIAEGRWSGIIADDTRGRFPAMVVRRVISKFNLSQGRKPIPLTYLAGPRKTELMDSRDGEPVNETDEAYAASDVYDAYLSDLHKLDPNGRKLLVTEAIVKGRNAQPMVELLSSNGIKCDILSFRTDEAGGDRVASVLSEKDPEAKIFSPGPPHDPDRQYDDVMNVDKFLDYVYHGHISSFDYPIDKFGVGRRDWKKQGTPEWRERQAPVGTGDTNTDEYILWRKLAQQMADRIYERVFVENEAGLATVAKG